MQRRFPAVTELWRVFTGDAAGRTSPEQVTVFDSVGFAVEDFSALRHVRAATLHSACLRDIDIIAEPADPKDLFALVAPAYVPV